MSDISSPPYDQDLILAEVERKLPIYDDYTEEQLLAEISQVELGSQLEYGSRVGVFEPQVGSLGGADNATILGTAQIQVNTLGLGDWFMRKSRFHSIICYEPNKNLLNGLLDVGLTVANVTQVVTVLLPLLGISAATIVIPAAVVAIAVLLIRYGIDRYCIVT